MAVSLLMAKPDFLTTLVAAQILGCSIRSVHRFVHEGTLVPVMRVKVGPNGAFLFEREDVEKLVKARSLGKPTMNVPLIGDDPADVKKSA